MKKIKNPELLNAIINKGNFMENRKTDINELSEKVLLGLRMALKKLVETSAANNEELVIGDKVGKIISIPAKDLLPSVQNNSPG